MEVVALELSSSRAVVAERQAGGEATPEGAEPPAEQGGPEPLVTDEAVGAAEEAPAEEIPAEETPAEETPAEEASAEEASAEEASAEETPAEATGGRRRGRGRPGRSYEQRLRSQVRGAARQCFQQTGSHGSVTVQVSVAHDGRITTSRVVNNATGNQTVARCISGALVGRRIGTSGPRSGATLNVSFQG